MCDANYSGRVRSNWIRFIREVFLTVHACAAYRSTWAVKRITLHRNDPCLLDLELLAGTSC